MLSARTQHIVFRSVQEAINNVVQHAAASHVRVFVHTNDTEVFVRVEDDGKGFALPDSRVQLARGEHWGLVGMMERAESVGGTCTITSKPGHGTKIRITIPLPGTVSQTPPSWTDRLGRWIHKGGVKVRS